MDLLTPRLELETHFALDEKGRIVSTREQQPARGPLMSIIHNARDCAWAMRNDVAEEVVEAVTRLFEEEAPTGELDWRPVHLATYLSLTGGRLGFNGPAFAFPRDLPQTPGVVEIHRDEELLPHFQGWVRGEIAEGRAPVLGILDGGCPVSICFSARSTAPAAAAGLETSAAFRGRDFALRVAAAWATTIRTSARVPLYGASRDNRASLSVARKLGLVPHAICWAID